MRIVLGSADKVTLVEFTRASLRLLFRNPGFYSILDILRIYHQYAQRSPLDAIKTLNQDFQFDIIRDTTWFFLHRYFYIIINKIKKRTFILACENVQTLQITTDRKEFQSVKPTILAENAVKGRKRDSRSSIFFLAIKCFDTHRTILFHRVNLSLAIFSFDGLLFLSCIGCR